ncbi:acetylornithine deacetylase [Echinicola strongylocentroti]|uniref:Acetylornithine deacetylase n=1 Tax=Echinicola strongylocentroti TaxID=1795355 RepID=A0A2Z4IE69_9BACT|nr:M20 family metallo-hydrolase [Echinicola strongylocentroti]AWW29119.1 acetylornithine deacetylase [Echinicola strongylocentroti]
MQQLKEEAKQLLQQLIATPSLSREEENTAQVLADYLTKKGVQVKRSQNNVWATNKHFDPKLPTVLLNSHHDTVKPNNGYTKDPFKAIVEDGKLYGLGSNDAGGCLVSLIAVFVHFYDRKLPFNLILAATAEEEVSGKNGIASLLGEFPTIALAIVGEPTLLDVAVAEKGLMVIDATVTGKAGHAARDEGINALYEALPDLNALKDYTFKKVSDYLGESKVSATIIQAGSQHNVVPDKCVYTLDVRVTDSYTLQEALDELQEFLKADLQPRSMRLNSSALPKDHRIWEVIDQLSLKCYGSPTLSDQALIPYPSIKIGPGDSARSHTPDEFIHLEEIDQGIERYVAILDAYANLK